MISHISVIVVTKNEEKRIARCLKPLSTEFSDIRVVDSMSDDNTVRIAKGFGAQVTDFHWNGKYPKKYQWCLDHLDGLNDWVLFVDADEIVTPPLIAELEALPPVGAGYYVTSRYRVDGKILNYGMVNKKLCLLNRHKMIFPVVDDLDIKGGVGEIEGHYQPVKRPYFKGEPISKLQGEMIHEALDDPKAWAHKHEHYAQWEAEMDRRNAWPPDPSVWRNLLKRIFRALPLRGVAAFIHSYIWKGGFMDGSAGYRLARSRYLYYRRIAKIASETSKHLV